jgi:hypothetical protein
MYVLLRFMAHRSAWGHRFTRLFAVTRLGLVTEMLARFIPW